VVEAAFSDGIARDFVMDDNATWVRINPNGWDPIRSVRSRGVCYYINQESGPPGAFLMDPNRLPDPFYNAFPLLRSEDTSGWFVDPVLGWLYANGSAQLFYHPWHGWQHFVPAGEAAYLFDQALGWLFYSPNTYPYLYSFTHGAWLYYFPDTRNPRWFRDMQTMEWFTI
jgi:hypothetical protein